MEKKLTATEARELSERVSLGQGNQGTVNYVYKLIEATATLGYNKIVITIFPEMFDTVVEAFPGYTIVKTEYKDALYENMINILIIW